MRKLVLRIVRLLLKQADEPKKVKQKIEEILNNKIIALTKGELFLEPSKTKVNNCDLKLVKIGALLIYDYCLKTTSGKVEDVVNCLEDFLEE